MGKKKHEKGAGSTPATVQLEQAGIPFKTYEYAHSNDHMDDNALAPEATPQGHNLQVDIVYGVDYQGI